MKVTRETTAEETTGKYKLIAVDIAAVVDATADAADGLGAEADEDAEDAENAAADVAADSDITKHSDLGQQTLQSPLRCILIGPIIHCLVQSTNCAIGKLALALLSRIVVSQLLLRYEAI